MNRNRCIRTISVALAVACAAVSGIAAEEIVHFANGTTMPIRGHEVHDGMLHVQLMDMDGFIAFPMGQVERITDSGHDVFVASEWKPANVATEGSEPRGKSGIRVRGQVSTGGPAFGRDTARDARARAKRRSMPDTPDLDRLVAAAAAAQSQPQPVEPGLRRAAPDAANSKMRSLKVAGRSDAFAASGPHTGKVDQLGVAVNGEMKLMPPGQTARSNTGVEVLRMTPSEQAAAAAVAAGTPLRNRPAPPPPPPAEGGAGDGN